MDATSFDAWVSALGRAWETRDARAAAALFTEDASYQEDAFGEPMRGRDAILAYWSEVPTTQENIEFGYEVIIFSGDVGIAHWWASFRRIPSGAPVKLDGVFAATMGAQNRCRVFREWWQKQEDGAQPPK